jgi:hypothetical protein
MKVCIALKNSIAVHGLESVVNIVSKNSVYGYAKQNNPKYSIEFLGGIFEYQLL